MEANNGYQGFPKIPRLFRDIVITEKVDGTNAQIFIDDTGKNMMVGSRSRWLTAESDNFGFCRWCNEHFEELLRLGPGHHFGEWFGAGIQRNYGLKEKRFALFNVHRWYDPKLTNFARTLFPNRCECPSCCTVVPVLHLGNFTTYAIDFELNRLSQYGSVMVPGFMKPEGVVVYHTAGKTLFKATIENDHEPKGITV